MNSKFYTVAEHAVMVGLHIAFAIFLTGAFVYFQNHLAVPAWFSSDLVHYGVPVGIVNMVWAGIVKWFNTEVPTMPTIDTAPPTNAQS